MRGLIYRSRLRRAHRMWNRQRLAERNLQDTGNEKYRDMSAKYHRKAYRLEIKARDGGCPR